MRILVDAVAAYSGAGPTHVRELASVFPTQRPQGRFLFVVQPTLEAIVKEVAPNVETLSPPSRWARPPARLLWENAVVPRLASDWQADVVYSPFNTLPLRWPSTRPRLVVLVFNLAPYAQEVTDSLKTLSRLRLRTLRGLTNRSLAIADLVFVLSGQAFDLIGRSLPRQRTQSLRVSPPPSSVLPSALQRVAREPTFLVAADLIRHKGIDTVIEALAKLRPEFRPSVLLCGRPLDRAYVDRLVTLTRKLGLEEQVRLLGWVEHPEVMALMRSAAACIVPSRFENMSLVPFEAMAAGTAVIATRIPVFEESCGDAALYFRLGDSDELADQMRVVLASDETRTQLVNRARVRVEDAGPSLSQQILVSLEQLVDTRSGRN